MIDNLRKKLEIIDVIEKRAKKVFLLSLKKFTIAENLSSSELYSAIISPKD